MSSGYSSCSNAYIYGTMYAEYSCSFWETSGSASVANNTSKVSWSGKVDYDHSADATFTGNTRDEAGYIKVIVNGSVVQTSTVPMDSGMSPGYRLRTFSGTSGAIAHNADGSKSVSCRVEMSSGSDPYGGGFTWSGSTGSTDTVKLTTIARASNPSINTWPSSDNKFTLGDQITIHMNRASSSFTHKVTFYYGPTGKNTRSTVVGTGVTNNVAFNTANIASQFLKDNPNSSSLTGKISVITYNGSTNIGTKEITYTASIPNTYAPTYDASSLVIDETALDPYGIADKVIVRYISRKYITIKVAAKEGATIKSVQLQSGSRTANCTVVDSTNGVWGGTITNMEAGEIKVVVTDSRGKTATYTIPDISIVNYSYPTISKGTLERTNASTGASDARVYGTFWNGSAGTVTNDITITYRLSNSSTTVDFTNIQKQGNNYDTGQVSVGNLDPQSSFSIYFEGEDSFGQKVSLTVQLPSAHNALWVGKKTVRAHDYLIADTDVWLNDGSVKLSKLNTDVYDFFGKFSHHNIYNGNWSGSWTNQGSVAKYFEIQGKGLVFMNCYVRNSGVDDTGQCDATIYLRNGSNAAQGLLASSANRVSISASHQISAGASTQWFYDGSSANKRLSFHLSCTKNGTNTWRVQITTVGCSVKLL